MRKDISYIILEELREFRKDTNTRLASLEDSRAEGKGIVKTIMSVGAISAAVSWFTSTIHH